MFAVAAQVLAQASPGVVLTTLSELPRLCSFNFPTWWQRSA
jgi:siroheme synthase (precorrin-2 oxidase/ferrochelatase)